MNKNTKNLLTAGAVIVGGIILLKGAKEFLDDGIPSGSFGGVDTGPVDTKVWAGDGKTADDNSQETPKQETPKQETPKKADTKTTSINSTSLQYAPLGSTPTSTFGILGELPISLLANTWSFTGGKVGSGGGVYYPATKIYIDSSGQGYSVAQAPMGAYVNNQGLYDASSQTFTDVFGQKTSMKQEDASNRQLNIKQTSSTPLQTPDTSKLSETKLGYDVIAVLINPITYLPMELASQVGMEYNDYLVTQNEGKNILERNYTAEELEKMSPFEKSIKQEYQKVVEPFKTTGSAIKGTAIKVGASQLSAAKKVISYAQSTASNVVNSVKTSVGSTKSSSSKSSSSSRSSSSGSNVANARASNVKQSSIVSGRAGTLTTQQKANFSSGAKFVGLSNVSKQQSKIFSTKK